ncbi:RING/FYVE/PHD zinc finger superfamily protein [Thalictrum thalictroides]|uniref:RING/FYVE/PHD zinc finger superfamily protein n=1 Tax=Thalictrum thalictroides TaxID=46969 RepID=A0A7J6XAM9_THATH|nr:RING/FYVE/PHD zinc finger superfamily protein [Thalictrum thalictroides]
MGDHFVLLVDRLLTESTLEAAIESRNRSLQATPLAVEDNKTEFFSHKKDFGDGSPAKMVECRICQDEDEDLNMETPCSCCGSLKYAHRRCVQKWCNEKGDTMCEICHQQFKPGYTAPPRLFHYGGVPMNFRGNWEISRRDLHNPRIIAMVSTDRNFLDPDYDEYSMHTTRSLICCRTVAIIDAVLLNKKERLAGHITLKLVFCLLWDVEKKVFVPFVILNSNKAVSFFDLMIWKVFTDLSANYAPIILYSCLESWFMVLLVLRHTLPIIISGTEEYSFTLLMMLLLRTAGILLPVYIMVRAVTAIQHRRSQQGRDNPSLSYSDDEEDQIHLQSQPHIIRVQ